MHIWLTTSHWKPKQFNIIVEQAFYTTSLIAYHLIISQLGREITSEVVTNMAVIERIVRRHRNIRQQLSNPIEDCHINTSNEQLHQLLTFVIRLDLVTAVRDNRPPRFPILRSTLPILPPIAMADTTILKVSDSPLFSHHSLDSILQRSVFCEKQSRSRTVCGISPLSHSPSLPEQIVYCLSYWTTQNKELPLSPTT